MAATRVRGTIVTATLRRRAAALAVCGCALSVAALAFADARLAGLSRIESGLITWPRSLPEIAAIAALLGSLLVGAAVTRSNAQGVHGTVWLVGVGVLGAAVYWMSQFKASGCTRHFCSGYMGHAANWWLFWSLTAVAAGCALLACHVAADIDRPLSAGPSG
jgi:hypothetical protein